MPSILSKKVSRNLLLLLAIDAVAVAASLTLSYLGRFELRIPAGELDSLLRILPWVVPLKLAIFALFHLYRGMWRYTSIEDLIQIAKAVAASSTLVILTILLVHRFQGYPRSVFFIDGALTFLAVSGIRLAIRIYFSRPEGISVILPPRTGRPGGRRLIIIGAGDAGEKVLREIRDNPGLNLTPVGFLDDAAGKEGKTIHGVPVLGGVERLPSPGVDYDEILIAIPSARADQMRRIVAACEKTGKRFRTVPGLGELIDGRLSVKAIREVTLEDLFGRDEVVLDQGSIRECIHGRRVLVTGAGGSVGAELVRQLCRFNPQAVGLLEMNELNLFRMDMECRQRFGYVELQSYLVDIRRREVILNTLREFVPNVVFHAAAYKHVPIQEVHPWEAVYNNVIGTRNLVEAALEQGGVERFVLVSTDKAVRPSNVMGATKRVAEMLVACVNGRSKGSYMAVRFGNVLASSGSVIPIFQEQISRGGPVTVTHPEVTRYFMSVSEAAQLILQAAAIGKGGEIFVLDMGEPVRILDLARDLIRLNGYEPDRDIPIQFIGLRPGEKLHEELITDGEGILETGHEKIMVLKTTPCPIEELNASINALLEVVRTYDPVAIKRKLKEIVPEYTPQGI